MRQRGTLHHHDLEFVRTKLLDANGAAKQFHDHAKHQHHAVIEVS
jgi:hypothetical protein